MKKVSGVVLLGILLSACTVTAPAPPAMPKTMETAIIEAGSTPTVTATVTVQASTDTPKPTESASSAQLPGWLAEPNTNIVATITNWEEHAYQFAFFGENINEKYEMTLQENFKGYFWQDTFHFGFLNQDNTVSILDLQTGKTSSQIIPAESLRFLEDLNGSVPKALFVSKPMIEDQNFFFALANDKYKFSKDWKYHARQEDFTNSEGNIIVKNTNTGETYAVTTAQDHLWNINFAWSNQVPAQLSILQSKSYPEGRVHGNQIVVVDPSTKETVGPYVDNYSDDFKWSPDDKKFLFYEYDRGIACIFYREENKHKCIHGMSPKGSGLFKWSADQKSILFVHNVYTAFSNGENFTGRFCQFNLENGTTTCSSENIGELKHNSITDHQTSPDGRYVILQLECRGLTADYVCNPTHALMSLEGEYFRILDKSYYENIGYINANELLWRPITNEEQH